MLLSRAPAARSMLGGAIAVVVDELHAWAPSQRGVQLCALLARLDILAGTPLQRVGLSATVADASALVGWFDFGGTAARCVVSPPPLPVAREIDVQVAATDEALVQLASPILQTERCLVFCDTRRESERVGALLAGVGLRVGVHHGGVGPSAREATEASARAGQLDVVCTSTLELGIDIGALDRVLQIGPPPTVTSLMQRLGRTGRRGAPARMLIVCADQTEANTARAMAKLALDGWLEPLAPVQTSPEVFAQQARAISVAEGGLDPAYLAQICHRTAALAPLAPRIADELATLAQAGQMQRLNDGRWVLTPPAERRLSYRGYSRLCSVITDPSGATVEQRTPNGSLLVGELRPTEADRLAAGDEVRLGGRSWVVREVSRGVVWV